MKIRLKIASVLAGTVLVLYLLTALIVVVVDRRVGYHFGEYNVPLFPNFMLLLILATVVLLVWLLLRHVHISSQCSLASAAGTWLDAPLSLSPLQLCVIGLLGSLVCCILQQFIFSRAGVVTQWDVRDIRNAATIPGHTMSIKAGEYSFYYMSHYPNNWFMLALQRLQFLFAQAVFPTVKPEVFFARVSIVIVSLTFLFFVPVAAKLLHRRWSFIGAALMYLLLICLSPWAHIPYSDSYGLFCCALLLLVATYAGNRPWGWALLGLFGYVAYSVKPTTVFILLSLVVAKALVQEIRQYAKQIVLGVVCFAVGVVISYAGVARLTNSLDVDWDPTLRFTATHFLMMGLQKETDGVFYWADIEFSNKQPTVELRQKANLAEVKRRVEGYGPWGLARLWLNKLRIAFNDGTFAWKLEGHFVGHVSPARGRIASFFKSLYGYGDHPHLYKLFCTYCQTLWLIVLMGVPFGLLGLKDFHSGKSRAHAHHQHTMHVKQEQCQEEVSNYDTRVIVLTMTFAVGALLLFLLVFEVRARYIYLYGGFYVLLAVLGYESLVARLHTRKPQSYRTDRSARADFSDRLITSDQSFSPEEPYHPRHARSSFS